MKKIKLTEDTLVRIVDRVIKEQEKESKNKELMNIFAELKKDPDNQELLDKAAELTKSLGLPVTPKAKQDLKI